VSRRYGFSRWLVKQNERQDAVGAFARFVMSDDDAPIGAFRAQTWGQYLAKHDAPQAAQDGVELAFAEWADHNSKAQP
jgi:hypothetical protein